MTTVTLFLTVVSVLYLAIYCAACVGAGVKGVRDWAHPVALLSLVWVLCAFIMGFK
jgi:hypothetical protein